MIISSPCTEVKKPCNYWLIKYRWISWKYQELCAWLLKRNLIIGRKKKNEVNCLTTGEFVGHEKITEEMFRKSDTLEGLKRNFNVMMSFQVKNHVLVM